MKFFEYHLGTMKFFEYHLGTDSFTKKQVVSRPCWEYFIISFFVFWTKRKSSHLCNGFIFIKSNVFKTDFSPQNQEVIHCMRYVFETLMLTLFLGVNLQLPKCLLYSQYLNKGY